jgi:hypothetical protein
MDLEEKLNDIDRVLNVLNTEEIQYIYAGMTQQPIGRKWQQQAELRQPPEFDFTWDPPTKNSVLTRIVLLDRNISLDEYKNAAEYVITYLINRLMGLFGKKCVNPPFVYQFNHMEYGDVYQFYIFTKGITPT